MAISVGLIRVPAWRGAISSATTSRTATISAPGKRSSTARTNGSCITLSMRAALAALSSVRPGSARRLRWRWRPSSARRSSRCSFCCRSPARVRGARGAGAEFEPARLQPAPDACRFRYAPSAPARRCSAPARRCLPGCARLGAFGAPSRRGRDDGARWRGRCSPTTRAPVRATARCRLGAAHGAGASPSSRSCTSLSVGGRSAA